MPDIIRTLSRAGAVFALVFLLSLQSAIAGTWQRNVSLGGFANVNIYTPATYSPIGPANKKSLMLVLHGCAQSYTVFDTAKLEVAADAYGMVIAVPDAANKAGFSCWAYWTGTKSRASNDYKRLIDLANAMSGDAARQIDPDQVYIAGLSSGASFANTTACLAPDVFAGMGVSAGPSIGTSSNGALGPCEAADVAARCDSYAGSAYRQYFSTQIASIAQGDADTTVNQCYNTQNSEGMAELYGVEIVPGSTTISEGSTRTAQETLWEDGRVSRLWFNGVAHAWSGGEGASGAYISNASINYASYLADYFAKNNVRVDRNEPPVIAGLALSESNGRISVSASITDVEGTVASANVAVNPAAGGAQVDAFALSGSGSAYSGLSAPLADALYMVTVTATDDEGAASEPASATVRIGPPPPPSAPDLSDVAVNVVGQCATVMGTVVDQNQDLDTIVAVFANGSAAAALTGAAFEAEKCGLPGGANSVTVTATDLEGLSDAETVSFAIDAGQTATLQEHINAGRLDYTNYANCYLEYGTAAFKLNETAVSANQCRWHDDDASCQGPLVACSGGAGDPGGDPGADPGGSGCEQHTTFNYNQKTAGRAHSTGAYFTPDYFANGSDDPMPGSTWGTNTLHSTDGGTVWRVGVCPE